jgi:hypothetical protein
LIAEKEPRLSISIVLTLIGIFFLFSSPIIFVPALGKVGNLSAQTIANKGDASGCSFVCIYVSDENTGQLSMIGMNTNKVQANISLPHRSVVFGVSYVTATKMVWVGDEGIGKVLIVNPATNTIVRSINVSGAAFMRLAPNGKMYVAEYGYSAYAVISSTTYRVLRTLPACGATPEFLDYNQKDRSIYAPVHDGCYDLINTVTNRVTHVKLGDSPTGVATNQATGNVYITDSSQNVTYVVKGTKLFKTLTSNYFTDGRLWGAFYSPASADIYVAVPGPTNGTSFYGSTVVPITSSNKLLPPINVGAGPDFGCYLAFNGDTLVTNTHDLSGQDANVTLISNSNMVITTIKLASGPSVPLRPFGCAET